MKTLYLVFLLIGLSQSESDRPNAKCWRECDPANYVALVKCKTGEENVDEPCTCEKKDAEPDDVDCTTLINDVKGTLSWTQCHDLAKVNGAAGLGLEASFFRWEMGTDETLCYFLPNCDKEISGECAPFDTAHCVAGPSTEDCEDDPEDPAILKCPKASWDDHGLHWNCWLGNDVINPYKIDDDDTSLIPINTQCQSGKNGNLISDCSKWKWSDADDTHGMKVAQVICSDSGDIGVWEQFPVPADGVTVKNEEDEDILPDVNDAVCNCEPLTLTPGTLATAGLSLICDSIPSDDEIENGNACALLCDGHFEMYIECYKGIWMNTAEYPFLEVQPAEIKC